MKAIIRVDASHQLGFGHLFRSIALANELKKKISVQFFCNDYAKTLNIINDSGFQAIPLPHDDDSLLINYCSSHQIDFVIFDTLIDYSEEFIKALKEKSRVIFIHTYARGRFFADLAVYPAAHLQEELLKDEKWLVGNTRLLAGPDYVLLNENIFQIKTSKTVNDNVQKVVFLAGGSDPTNSLLRIHSWVIRNLSYAKVKFQFLVGEGSSYIMENFTNFKSDNTEFVPFSLNELSDADIAVCAFGVSTYELVYLGIPTIKNAHSEFHAQAADRFYTKNQCTLNVGYLSEAKENELMKRILQLIEKREDRISLTRSCLKLIDGKGISRVANEILKLKPLE
ncbi:MAG: hypothetical protein Q8P20_08885 [bacterium]|nr:hypothetical protein [bacterium]